MNVGMPEIHPVSFNGAGNAADKDDGPVRACPFHNTDVGQGVVQFSISVEVPRVIKEHEITWTRGLVLVEGPVLAHMIVDQPNTVCGGITCAALIEIDSVLQEDGARHPGAVVANAPPFACDRRCSDERGR